MKRVWQKVKESERMRGDKERTGVGKAFMLKRNLTNLKALLLKRDEWVGGWGQRVGKVVPPSPAMHPRKLVLLPIWGPQGLQPRHESCIAVPKLIATT